MKPVIIIAIAFVLLIPFSVFAEVTCPNGSFARVNDFGETICLDNTKRTPVEPIIIPDEIEISDEQMVYVVIGVIISIVIIAGIAKASSKSEPDSYKDVERMRFTPNTKERVKELQHGKCADCGKFPTHWEFDHIDTRGDNSIENCQGLCRDCHQDKTLKDNERHRDSEDE